MLPPILIVDDNQEAAELFKELLDMQGYAVRTAHDGAEALALMAAGPSAIFLVDLNLPDMHGTALAPQLRALAHAQGCDRAVMIAVTGMASTSADQHMGVFDHVLMKPVDFGQFDRLLEQCTQALQNPLAAGTS